MSLVKQASTYKATPVAKPVRRSLRIFDQHDSTLWVLTCLAFKHRVFLLATSNLVLLGVIIYPKVSWII